MTTYYLSEGSPMLQNKKNGQLLASQECPPPVVQIGDPLTIQFEKLRVVSAQFDTFGSSEILVVNNIKNNCTKERALDSVTYYDPNVRPTKTVINNKKYKTWTLNTFDADKYGNPTIFHTPGYQGTDITVTTNIYEIDDPNIFLKILQHLGSSLSTTLSIVPTIYTSIFSHIIGLTTFMVENMDHYRKIVPSHTFTFGINNKFPLYTGEYLCVPGEGTLDQMMSFCSEYRVEEEMLVKRASDGTYTEFPSTYYLMKIDNCPHEYLDDFDFVASSADLLKMLPSQSSTTNVDNLVQVSRESYDLQLIKLVKDAYDKWSTSQSLEDKQMLTALYRQLGKSGCVEWFNNCFPDVGQKLQLQ